MSLGGLSGRLSPLSSAARLATTAPIKSPITVPMAIHKPMLSVRAPTTIPIVKPATKLIPNTFLYRCGGNSIHKFNMLAIQVPILPREEEAIGFIARRELRSARSA